MLYASFSDKENAIGLRLIKALEAVNSKLGVNNFKAIVRLSKGNREETKAPRWTPQYLEEELVPLAGKIERVMVCGPPAVNEMMDKALESMAQKLMISTNQIQIL